MTKQLIAPPIASTYTGVPVPTLANWRYRGVGPRFIKVGRRVMYDVADLDDWLTAQTFQSTAESAHA